MADSIAPHLTKKTYFSNQSVTEGLNETIHNIMSELEKAREKENRGAKKFLKNEIAICEDKKSFGARGAIFIVYFSVALLLAKKCHLSQQREK